MMITLFSQGRLGVALLFIFNNSPSVDEHHDKGEGGEEAHADVVEALAGAEDDPADERRAEVEGTGEEAFGQLLVKQGEALPSFVAT